MHPRDILIRDHTYVLPDSRIAAYPLPSRDDSKLLIYNNGVISEDSYHYLDNHLPAGSLLVFNDSRVVAARILFTKPTGGTIEIFCLEPAELFSDSVHGFNRGFNETGSVYWQCLIGGASKWPKGETLKTRFEQDANILELEARFIEARSDCFIISLSWSQPNLRFSEILSIAGRVPLPPYIKRDPDKSDKERYQTVYAKQEGSVAAPTAGLHFTNELFKKLESKKIRKAFVTLHVGAGTFKPVSAEKIGGHSMHAETIHFSKSALQSMIASLEDKIVCVGTTSLRTLESMYWLGVRIMEDPVCDEKDLWVSQWEVYDQVEKNIPVKESFTALLNWMNEHELEQLVTRTSLLVAPGYKFRATHGLITNFHQPQSTLLLLVAAFIGDDWRKVYDYALKNDFRFLSYGDGCLLWLAPIP
ncbi:MAG TPA: S-adenosylmethionine:tRNA ribosyltransferase-isomerase [Chitinophagaceae bacterium]|nr:S-adenosylmethionine:tRNA ribosyltransferase-isomerase [Chitinophagaceae bacterium]